MPLTLALLLGFVCQTGTIEGRAMGVVDGDTVKVLDEGKVQVDDRKPYEFVSSERWLRDVVYGVMLTLFHLGDFRRAKRGG